MLQKFKYHKTTHVCCGGNYLQYTTYMPNQRINTVQKETHSKILPSPTYIEITKNSIGLSSTVRTYAYAGHYGYQRSAIEYTWQSTIVASCKLMKLGLYIRVSERGHKPASQ